MSYRRRFKRKTESGVFLLNITSMTDMFTMLLVFLLQTYASSEFKIDPEAGVRLPLSSSMKDPSKAPQVVVSQTAIKLDGETILSLDGGAFKNSDRDPGNPAIIKPLYEALRAKLPADGSIDSVLLQADSTRSMADLNNYFTTISAAGFAKVKLATVVGR